MKTPYILKALFNVLTDWKLLRLVLWRTLYYKGYLPLVISKKQAH